MENRILLKQLLLWSARTLGSLVVVFIMMFALGEALGGHENHGTGISAKDAITFIFFPASTVVGLLLALKWEGLGGLITLLGLIGLLIIRPDLLSSLLIMAIVTVPGVLYLFYWYLARNTS